MSGPPFGVPPGGTWQPPPSPINFEPPSRTPKTGLSTVLCLVISTLAIAIAIGSWFKPSGSEVDQSTEADSTSAQTVADAKRATTAVCSARELAGKAGAVAGGKTSDDPNMRFVVAVNSRLASAVSADYLAYILDQNPDTPPALSTPIGRVIESLNEITLLNLADSDESALEPIYKKLDDADAEAARECE